MLCEICSEKEENPMIKDITIGQYFPTNSVLHRLDVRVKLILTFLFIILIFLCKNYFSMLLMLVLLTAMVALSKVPFKTVVKGLRPLLIIIIFTAVLNVFYVKGGITLFSIGKVAITSKGVNMAVFTVLRIVCLIIGSSLLTYTTTPTALTDGLERLFSPLRHLHIEVHDIAMMMTIALRFIPTLIDEVDRIMNAQKARGADLESGGLIQRAKALVPVFVPLLLSAFRRADDLAYAMDCRCYHGGSGRTRMKQMKFHARDAVALCVVASVFVGIILLNHYFLDITKLFNMSAAVAESLML